MKRCKFTAVILSLLIVAVSSLMICSAADKKAVIPEGQKNWYSNIAMLDFHNVSAEGLCPVKLGNKTFVPLEPVSRILGIKLEAQRNGEFALSTGEEIIRGRAGSTEIIVNDKKQYLPLPVMKIENQIFVPDQFVKQCLNTEMQYNEEKSELIIKKEK